MNPIAVGIATTIALCTALWIAYSAGHDHGVQQCQLERSRQYEIDVQQRDEQIRAAQHQQDRLTIDVQRLERELAERQSEKEIIYQTITKEVIKYAQDSPAARCQPDADFVRLWNAAKDGRDPTASGAGKRGNAQPLQDTKR